MAFVQPPTSPAIIALRKSIDEAFPGRSKASDGAAGDAAHVARAEALIAKGGTPEGHVMGDALDVTTDPAHGVENRAIAEAFLRDKRAAYAISNGEIKSASGPWAGKGWRHYDGANRHDHHAHMSIRPELRNDGSPWTVFTDGGGEQVETPLTRKQPGSVKLVAIGAGVGAVLYYAAKTIFKW